MIIKQVGCSVCMFALKTMVLESLLKKLHDSTRLNDDQAAWVLLLHVHREDQGLASGKKQWGLVLELPGSQTCQGSRLEGQSLAAEGFGHACIQGRGGSVGRASDQIARHNTSWRACRKTEWADWTLKVHLRMYLWWSLCTLYLHACQVRVTVGDSGLCCCDCVTTFER